MNQTQRRHDRMSERTFTTSAVFSPVVLQDGYSLLTRLAAIDSSPYVKHVPESLLFGEISDTLNFILPWALTGDVGETLIYHAGYLPRDRLRKVSSTPRVAGVLLMLSTSGKKTRAGFQPVIASNRCLGLLELKQIRHCDFVYTYFASICRRANMHDYQTCFTQFAGEVEGHKWERARKQVSVRAYAEDSDQA